MAHSGRAWRHISPSGKGKHGVAHSPRAPRRHGPFAIARRKEPPLRPDREDRSPGPTRSNRGGAAGPGPVLASTGWPPCSHAAMFQRGLQDAPSLVRSINNQHATTDVQSWHPPWFGRNRTSLSGRIGEGCALNGQECLKSLIPAWFSANPNRVKHCGGRIMATSQRVKASFEDPPG